MIRTSVGDVNPGFPVQRSRSFASYKTVAVQWMMTQAQYAYLQFFFENLISGGADWFLMPFNAAASTGDGSDFSSSDFSPTDFATLQNTVMRFAGGTYSADFNEPYWKVTANLEYEDTAA